MKTLSPQSILFTLLVTFFLIEPATAVPLQHPYYSPLKPIRLTNSLSISPSQARSLIQEWLQAKTQIFAPPFDRQLVAELTTGQLYRDLVRPEGPIDWLIQNQARYEFGAQEVGTVKKFIANENKATLEVWVTEDRRLYVRNRIDPKSSGFGTDLFRYNFRRVGNSWKIADYDEVK